MDESFEVSSVVVAKIDAAKCIIQIFMEHQLIENNKLYNVAQNYLLEQFKQNVPNS